MTNSAAKTLVIEIPFPTKADGSPWPDTAWIEFASKGALAACSAFAVGSGALFNDATLTVRDD